MVSKQSCSESSNTCFEEPLCISCQNRRTKYLYQHHRRFQI
uniref:Uncharacterized protein n=1 Tax=Medicago truncatula TaxID=3880 RepID=I3SP76_MEDTR|nr:unknown [Medicago truncatula]